MNFIDKEISRAAFLRSRSKFGEAARVYMGLLKKSGLDPLQKAEAHQNAGDCLRLQGDFTGAKSHAREAAKLFTKVGSPRLVDAQVSLALALRASGDPQKAVGLLQKALKFYEADDDEDGNVFCQWALGGTLRIAGNLKDGWKHLKKAEALYAASGDKEGLGYTHCALGGLARMLGHYDESGRHYQAANRLHQQRKDTFGTAYSYCGMGNVERMNGRLENALVFFRKAEKLYKRIGDKVSYAYTRWSMGMACKLEGDLKGAKENFDAADGFFKTTGDLRGRSYVALGRAELLWMADKNGEPERKKAEAFAKAGGYAWELLHAKVMEGGKAAPNAKKMYAMMGSKFYPRDVAVNWP